MGRKTIELQGLVLAAQQKVTAQAAVVERLEGVMEHHFKLCSDGLKKKAAAATASTNPKGFDFDKAYQDARLVSEAGAREFHKAEEEFQEADKELKKLEADLAVAQGKLNAFLDTKAKTNKKIHSLGMKLKRILNV